MPHFIRFLTYGVLAAGYLEHLTIIRLSTLYSQRHLPSYLGPTIAQLITLFVITLVNTITLTGVGILLLRCLYSLLLNQTTIEGWELDRHATLLRRARYSGGWLDTPDGSRLLITKQEFPYDIGIWSNLVQAMGTRNVLLWLWPFASSFSVEAGTEWEVNGFDDREWPPVDPDRLFRVDRKPEDLGRAFTAEMDLESFRRRQEEDRKRWQGGGEVRRRKPFWVRLEEEKGQGRVEEVHSDEEDGVEGEDGRLRGRGDENGEEGWRNSEGERLADFGVDEDVEFYDEDDLPLAELMRRRKMEKEKHGVRG